MKRPGIFLLIALMVLITGACDRTGESGGRLVIKVTDDPFDITNIESASVTITKVEIKKAGDGISDGNAFVVLSEDTVTIDLIDLRNGVVETLLDMEVPEGEYDLIRLYVDQAGLKLKNNAEPFYVKAVSYTHLTLPTN
jgi:hypothetical protein